MVDATRIPDQLRENVWRGRIDAHRLHQYYGRLARVHTRNVSMVTTLGCFVAFVGPYLDTLGAPGWEIVVSLVGVVVAITTIAQGHNRIVEALFRHQQFGDLHVEWTDLWQRVEDKMAIPAEVQSRWVGIDPQGSRYHSPQCPGQGQSTPAGCDRTSDVRLLPTGGRLECPCHNLIPGASPNPNRHPRNARVGGRRRRIHLRLRPQEETKGNPQLPDAPVRSGSFSHASTMSDMELDLSASPPLTTKTSASTSPRTTAPSTAVPAGSCWRRAPCAGLRCRRSRGRCLR